MEENFYLKNSNQLKECYRERCERANYKHNFPSSILHLRSFVWLRVRNEREGRKKEKGDNLVMKKRRWGETMLV